MAQHVQTISHAPEYVQTLFCWTSKEGLAEGKAQDMQQTAALLGFDTIITGSTNDYAKTADSEVVVITSGIPRKPGMTREELIGTNAGIVKTVCENVLKYSPNTIIIVISNPMDTMTYLAMKSTGLPKHRIIEWVAHWIAADLNTSLPNTWDAVPVT